MKTDSSLWAATRVGAKTLLVTCPASVRSHWDDHIKEHVREQKSTLKHWDVISYNGASSAAVLESLLPQYDVWIGDEIHFCKSLDSQRSHAIFGRQGLARRASYKWPLSGTITPNYRPVELWPMLKTLCPAFKDMTFAVYAQKYCGAFWDGYQLNVKGASRIDELAGLLREFMLRRTEAEVYPNRIKPIVETVSVELTAEDLTAVNEETDKIGGREARLSSSYEKTSQMGDASRLRRMLGNAKTRHVVAYVRDLLETVPKVVVFAHHKEVIDLLKVSFHASGHSPVVYRGGMTDAQKDESKARFVKDENVRVFIGQDDTAGTGVDGLQRACSTMVFAEPSWVPGDTDQRLRRLARNGQKDPLVKAYLIYAKGTLDGVVTQVHDRKENVGERLMAPGASSVFDAINSWELL